CHLIVQQTRRRPACTPTRALASAPNGWEGVAMTRIDYIDDPNAPVANSVVPSVVATVRNDEGKVLLIHKTDNDLWALPGGGHEIGESIADAVVREVLEETGFEVEVTGLTGTYTNPAHVMAYEDGEVRQQFSIAFTAR